LQLWLFGYVCLRAKCEDYRSPFSLPASGIWKIEVCEDQQKCVTRKTNKIPAGKVWTVGEVR
jgi:hypothetical protein